MSGSVGEQSEEVKSMVEEWNLARALMGGTFAMRAAGAAYLPQWPAEDSTVYQTRLATSVLFPAFARTVTTLAAKPFSKPVTLSEDMPEGLRQLTDDIDRQGRNLGVFAGDLLTDALAYGLTGVLVDFPRTAGLRTRAEERSAGVRPYWVHVRPWQILGWRAEFRDSNWFFTQLRTMEIIDEPDGDYATKAIKQVRVLEPGRWTTFREAGGNGWRVYEEGESSLRYVPFVPIYGERIEFMHGRSPLLEIAHLNVAHWQESSDQRHLMRIARVPVLVATGTDDIELVLGGSVAVKLPAGGDLKFVEHSGAAIGAGRQALEDLKEEMRQAGAELLVLQPGKKTATQVGAEQSVGMCALQEIAETLEDALDRCLQITADWVGEPQAGSVSLFKDFGFANAREASAQLIVTMASDRLISDETARAEMKRRGILAPEVDEATESKRLKARPAPDPRSAV